MDPVEMDEEGPEWEWRRLAFIFCVCFALGAALGAVFGLVISGW